MPHYEYECTKCGHHFEVFQRMTDPKLEQCPKCGGKVERLIGPGAGIVFKGSGFYQTDYRSDSYKQKAKSEAGKTAGGKSEGPSAGDAGKKPAPPAAESAKPSADPAKPETKKKPEKQAGS